MRNLLIIILFLLQFGTFGYGQNTNEYTVIAPSGLSLREGPGMEHKRLTAAPFLASVQLLENDPDVYSEAYLDQIDEREGYWLPVSYQEKEGYMFSGYLKSGPLYRPSGEDGLNKDYRITVPGLQCQPVNYDPDLHWYGFYYDAVDSRMKVEQVDTGIEFGSSLEEADQETAYAEMADFTQLKTNPDKNYLFLLGSRLPIAQQQWEKAASFVEHNNPLRPELFQLGKYIYPHERLFLAKANEVPYFLVGHLQTSVQEYEKLDPQVIQEYQLFVSNSAYYGLRKQMDDSLELTKRMFEQPIFAHDYQYNRGPRLVWKGDLNGDRFPDLIFHQPDMSESCGGCTSYYVLLSQKTEFGFTYKKVAEESIWSCFGC